MAELSSGLKKLLTISPCTVDPVFGDISVDTGESFEVMLNPSAYSHSFSIKSSKKVAMGKSGTETKFNAIRPETVSFDLLIDGTGVVNPEAQPEDVNTQIQTLRDLVYTYRGEKHSPNPVRVLWGSLIFFGTLDSMSVEYTLFKPSGEPLRGKVKLAFTEFQSKQEESLRSNRSSPDVNHVVEVKAGDTLPLLCYQIYNDPAYYTEIARVNNLINFRSLIPGTRLHFPPLR